ncbi:heme ABC exporter ATP-binding protein CcmA [Candidatus Tisiphia endosymbiont of Nemotelus uliginosus]|uniref:heme ABC exporter ATP-binding protein CcmA n=1 Tax=Candidatus Tisiphia endosymbiont of Nemotelus uliginosus TaxID=3077926 RepID=UPI0035C8976B
MLSFEQLTFEIGKRNFFSSINMTLLPTSIVYLQGPNSCGKTSLLRMISGMQNPTKGRVLYRALECEEVKKPYCNYIGHNIGLKSQITILEHLQFWSKIYGAIELLEPTIYYFKLHNVLREKCYTLSAGNQKKVALAKLMLCQTDLWLLDEIEANLDQENKALLYNLIISKANNGGIIILTSHMHPMITTGQIINLQEYSADY